MGLGLGRGVGRRYTRLFDVLSLFCMCMMSVWVWLYFMSVGIGCSTPLFFRFAVLEILGGLYIIYSSLVSIIHILFLML